MSYIKQLDSVRAIAVILVIITHWLPENNRIHIYTSVFNGVDIFFVLSGFLITKILLENRNEAENQGNSKILLMKSFFTRRIIRIFPIYYLTLFILYIIGDTTETNIRNNFFYFFTYTSNFYFFERQNWDGMLSHLWSLSVEEQFYLIWPWLILFVNKKAILPLIITSVFVGITGQIFLKNIVFGDILTFSCFDGFGIGALLAWALTYKPQLLKKYYSLTMWLAILSLIFQIFRVAGHSHFVILPSRTLTSIFTLWLIVGIILNREKRSFFFNSLFSNPILIFVGKISYGIYLYHLILPYFTNVMLTNFNASLPLNIFRYNKHILHIENFFILMVISYLSWKIIEQPILKFKTHFKYQRLEMADQPKMAAK